MRAYIKRGDLRRAPSGRPYLVGGDYDDLSRAHCSDCTISALGRRFRLGVDVERADRDVGNSIRRWLGPGLPLTQAQSSHSLDNE